MKQYIYPGGVAGDTPPSCLDGDCACWGRRIADLLPHIERADPAELLGREAAAPELPAVDGLIRGQCVMVTGGGGSIGSELCRQAAAHGPRQLVILDWNENGAYVIREELRARYPGLSADIAIASVRDPTRMEALFARHRPDVVLHAAAHKHLPLMEEAPCEAVKNNVAGSLTTADLAGRHGCGTFVFISTDKAVNPCCVMGRTKRVGEMITAAMQGRYPGTRYLSVRFGNVLGSAGSVLPLFRAQIAAGGPVRVTHPDVTRFFMTIPEAAGLVLSAGAMPDGGGLFVLDMSEPVRILTLAENLIRLSGLQPYTDINIAFTGLRPGEKLHEELTGADEATTPTEHPRIRRAHCATPHAGHLFKDVGQLCRLAEAGREEETRELLEQVAGGRVIRLQGSAGD